MHKEDWEPQYVNDSRPGLLADGTSGTEDYFVTTNKDDFKWPEQETAPYARRRKLLRTFMYQQLAEDYIQEMTVPFFDEKVETTSLYQETYKGDGFDVRDIVERANPEIMAKYPLYTDQAHSVYFDKLKNIKSTLVSNDPAAAFRKYSYFSKPFYAELE